MRQAFSAQSAMFPVGGGSSLDYGLPAQEEGVGLSLAGLNRIVDYPARDLTVTVEAGVTLQQLETALAAENQCLPLNAPQASVATLGGIVATAFCGPRRYSTGAVRDSVIGIAALDGRGESFRGGGRVVKNVAGYDFCKLLTGSLGTLGVITELTFKLRPLPERSVLAVCSVADYDQAEAMLAQLALSDVSPAAIELLAGDLWRNDPLLQESFPNDDSAVLVVGLEGSGVEVDWMLKQLQHDWKSIGGQVSVRENAAATDLWQALIEFPAGESPLALKFSVTPSGVCPLMQRLAETAPGCSLQAHAGTGQVIARLADFPDGGLSQTLIRYWLPLAKEHHGGVVILKNESGAEMTAQACWGGIDAPFDLMTRVKQQFDPRNLLNPHRFVYHAYSPTNG